MRPNQDGDRPIARAVRCACRQRTAGVGVVLFKGRWFSHDQLGLVHRQRVIDGRRLTKPGAAVVLRIPEFDGAC